MAKIYPFEPRPQIIPVATLLMSDFCLNSSLLYIFEICNSIIGFLNISSASRIDTDVWVYPAALIIIPSYSFLAFCILVTISPSKFDWKKSNFIPIFFEYSKHKFFKSLNVIFPYWDCSLSPNRLRFGPLIIIILLTINL